MTKKILFLLLMLAVGIGASAQKSFESEIWQGKPKVKSKDTQDTAKIYVYLPAKTKASGRAIIICPGGGYEHLAIDHEGKDWASFFNRQGIAVIVLKYRMPHGNKEVPISDLEQTMKMARLNAENWHINANDIGVMGFSAGGHLASTLATHGNAETLPNFQILFYPVITMDPEFTHTGSHDNLLGKKPRKKDEVLLSNDVQVSRSTPRALIVLSDDDDCVAPVNGVNYYFELYKHDVPASIMVYPTGGHGYGINPDFPYHLEMLMNVKAWLDSF